MYYQDAYNTSNLQCQNAIDAVVQTYNGCISTYNTCVLNYYNFTATPAQKAIIDLQTQNKIEPVLQNTEYVNGVLMSTLQNNYNTFYPSVTKPYNKLFSILNNPLEVRLQYLGYDNHGNLLSVQKAADIQVSYLWGL